MNLDEIDDGLSEVKTKYKASERKKMEELKVTGPLCLNIIGTIISNNYDCLIFRV